MANEVLKLYTKETNLKRDIKMAKTNIDTSALKKYSELTIAEVQDLVVDHKWLAHLQIEIEIISQSLTITIKTIAERYNQTLTDLNEKLRALEEQVN
jgi:type I restriction enzyme M protein